MKGTALMGISAVLILPPRCSLIESERLGLYSGADFGKVEDTEEGILDWEETLLVSVTRMV